MIDHISSMPAVIYPIAELSKLAKENGAIVIIDGAHAVGQIPLDMKALNVDFYFSNFHKWAFTPKSVAFLYIDSKFID